MNRGESWSGGSYLLICDLVAQQKWEMRRARQNVPQNAVQIICENVHTCYKKKRQFPFFRPKNQNIPTFSSGRKG